MAKAGYSAPVGAAVALVAATAKSVLSVIAPAQFGVDLTAFQLSFDGVTASAIPAVIELVRFTADGTGTVGTVVQAYGPTITAGFTSKYNYSVEPTGQSVIQRWTLTPNGGTIFYDWSLGKTPDTPVSQVLTLRVTAPAIVNCNATMWFERT